MNILEMQYKNGQFYLIHRLEYFNIKNVVVRDKTKEKQSICYSCKSKRNKIKEVQLKEIVN